MDDIEIIELFFERNEKAITELSGKYSGYCYKIAWNLLFNREDAEECINDTWFAAWNYIPPKRPKILAAFVGRITRGFAIDTIRKKMAGKRTDSHMVSVLEEMDQLNFTYTIDEQMAEKELLMIINHFLRQLSEVDRDIFIRRYWYMDSLKEIATRHGMSVGNVKTNLYRKRKKLYKKLRKEGVCS